MKEVLSAIDVARKLRVGRRTVLRLIENGTLKGFKRGRLIRVTAASVQRLLDGQTAGAEKDGERP